MTRRLASRGAREEACAAPPIAVRCLPMRSTRTTRDRARRPALHAAVLFSLALGCRASAPRAPGAISPASAPATSSDTVPADTTAATGARNFGKRLEFTILEDYDKGDSLSEVARDFDLYDQLGIRAWRGSLGWDDYEPAAGRYDFAWLHRFAALARKRGITLRPYIGYTPEWAAVVRTADGQTWNDPPKRVEDFARFAGALATALRRHGNVASYEIYNEENSALWWDGTPAEYATLLARGGAAIHLADPGARVVMGGLVWPDAGFLETVCTTPGVAAQLDVVALHAYPETWSADSVTVERWLGSGYDDFLRTVRERCGAKPVWLNETGYATANGHDEHDQADWWARAIATWAADRHIAEIGVYEVKDRTPRDATRTVTGADSANFHLGLTTSDRTPKLAFHTVRTLVALLGGQIVVADGELHLPSCRPASQPDAHLFRRRDGRQILVAWMRRGRDARSVTLRLTHPGAGLVEWSLDGTRTELGGFDGRTLKNVRLAPGTARIFEILPAVK